MSIAFSNYIGLPLVGAIRTDGGTRVLHVSSVNPKDERDVESFYAATTLQLEKPVVFLFDPEEGGLLLQAVENRSNGGRGKTDGMFLAVHNAFDSDRLFPNFLRAIVHIDPKKAAVWEFVEVEGQTLLQIKANRAGTGRGTVGWFLAVPPGSERDSVSSYLAVTPDAGLAMPVEAVALAKE